MRAVAAVGIAVAMVLWVPHMIAAGASFPVADAFIMWLSIAASIMMLWKYLENWLLWITVDLIAIPVYWSKGLHITSGLYVIFLCLATYGLWKWWTEYKDSLPVRTGQSAWIP
jgi:nicotinamide mononucleotide transporter